MKTRRDFHFFSSKITYRIISGKKHEIEKLCKELNEIFHKENRQLRASNTIQHEIQTTDKILVYTGTFRYTSAHKQEIQQEISKMLVNGITRPSQGP